MCALSLDLLLLTATSLAEDDLTPQLSSLDPERPASGPKSCDEGDETLPGNKSELLAFALQSPDPWVSNEPSQDKAPDAQGV